MKLTTPEIVWHSKEPVFSADFHHSGELWRLATGGADKDVKIWKLVQEKGKVKLVFMASLTRHSGAVNVVRFSPNGELLASAGDDNVICLWKMGEGGGAGGNVTTDTTTPNKENWSVTKMLKGHLEDIYDACWSANSDLLVTGSVDNTAIVWDVRRGQSLCTLGDSKQYVQGVTWDPMGQYLATLSNDRHLRIYSATDQQKFKCVHTIAKLQIPGQERGTGNTYFRMWIEETLSFFRRLAFSPDGNLLVVPAGRYENGDKVINTTYIFTKSNLTKPAVSLPYPEKATVVVKFCPVLFTLRDSIEKDKSLFSLPYRMVYAVASLDAVLLYDTQQTTPFAYLSNIHYSGITDLAWSNDGLVLVITSSDAYCSIVTFDPGELGIALATEQIPKSMKRLEKTPENAARKSPGEMATENGPKMSVNLSKETKQMECSNWENGVSTAGEDSKLGTTTASRGGGVKRDIKGKRRIHTTFMESFTSEMETKSPPNSTSSVPGNASPTQPRDETGKTSLSNSASTADVMDTSDTNSTSVNQISPSSCGKKSPRRIQLVTLSPSVSPPLQRSHDSDSKSHDQDSTHSLNPTRAAEITTPTDPEPVATMSCE